MDRYLIIADDFTGANDTGVQLRRRGLPTSVIFAGRPLPKGEGCVVIDTESRGSSPEGAGAAVSASCAQVNFADYKYVIKKVDSTLRGNIAAEVAALDRFYKPELVVFMPALPALGRTTVNGIHCLKGVPLTETELASDPKNPVREDNINKLLSAAYLERVAHVPLEEVRGGFSLEGGRVFSFDAVTDEDMQRVIAAAKATGKRALYIGTAAMADNIMALESTIAPVLGVIASVSDVTCSQVRAAEAAGVNSVVVPFHDLLSGEKSRAEFVSAAVESLKSGRDTMVVSSSTLSREELEKARLEGEKHEMVLSQVSDYVRGEMGALAAEILAAAKVSGVFVTGGDTALGLLEALEADGSEILSEVSVGIPMMRLIGGPSAGVKMVTKAGAFGTPDAINNAVRKLKEA